MGIFGNNDDDIAAYEKAKEAKKKMEELEEQKKLRESAERLAKNEKKQEEKKKKDAEEKEKRIEKMRKKDEERLEKEEREADLREAEEDEKREEREKRKRIRKDEDKIETKKQELEDHIANETNKIEQETIKIKKEKEKSQKLIKFYKNNVLKFKNKLKELEKKEKAKITQKKKIEKKIEKKERLYDPNIIKSIDDDVTLRIFYDPEKKQKAYWKYTDFINRIEIREEEMKKELKIPQNIINLSIRWTSGEKYRNETVNSGGVMKFHPFDAPTYNLRISITVEEQYLIKKIMSLIKRNFPKMAAMDGKLGISAFLEDQNYNEEYSRRIIQTITRRTCEEFEKLGDVLIDEY